MYIQDVPDPKGHLLFKYSWTNTESIFDKQKISIASDLRPPENSARIKLQTD